MEKIGFDKGMFVGYTAIVVSFLLVFFGIRSYRENVGNGHITFGRGLAVGILIALITSLSYVATWEIIYFKLYKSQIPVIEQSLEMASRLLGSDKPRGYCLELICADFLAGASLDHDPHTLLVSVSRLVQLLPEPQKLEFLHHLAPT